MRRCKVVRAFEVNAIEHTGEVITKLYKPDQAGDVRDAISKALYGRCFTWIVQKVNLLLGPKTRQLGPKDKKIGETWLDLHDIVLLCACLLERARSVIFFQSFELAPNHA